MTMMLDTPADSARPLGVLHGLVEVGNSPIVVEHNLDVVKAADWVSDLGPEGGAAGCRLIAEDLPEQIAESPVSHTSEFLRGLL